MRLSKIKLSGFKSFVDPTTISFPGNLLGVVGPNGCGKSNIIDAVRWVLGESSAKTLRGDSMADVIFNGSSSRKPIGQASIELVFDNSDGKITGAYAGYSEVAMRRVVSRDGTSQYFLNNARCRRKDITNLLLGTGVGSHGYSIIEQGMISRIVEAKPEELRSFLEEAAGISKYKERRRETEHRIRHTRDNLERLQDLRDELERQLGHLQRQARAAERFKVLKAEERRTSAELLILRLQSLEEELNGHRRELAKKQLGLDSALTGQGGVETEIEKHRLEMTARSDAFNQIQGRYYKVGADIARLEQSIEHRNSDIQRQTTELEQTSTQLEKVSGHISDDEIELERLDQLLGRLNPELQSAQAALESAERILSQAESDAERARDQVEETAARIAGAEQSIQVEEARLEHLTGRLERIDEERQEKESERSGFDSAELELDLDRLTAAEESQRSEAETVARALETIANEIHRLRREDSSLVVELDRVRERLQRDQGRLSSLAALQEAALGSLADEAVRWLQEANRGESTRLAERLEVEAGWERAVEATLGGYLNAIETQGLGTVLAGLETIASSGIALVEREQFGSEDRSGASVDFEPLASKVAAPAAARGLLAGVYAAADLDSALEARTRLRPGERIITVEGVEVTRHALRTHAADDPQLGVIARGEEIDRLQGSVAELSSRDQSTANRLEEIRSRLGELENQQSEQQAQVRELQARHSDTRMELETRRTRLEDMRHRLGSLEAELIALEDESYAIRQAMQEARVRLDGALEERTAGQEAREQLESSRGDCVSKLKQARTDAEQHRERAKEIAIMVESRRSSKQSASAALERVQAQQRYLEERRTELATQINAMKVPLAQEQRALESELDRRLNVEKELATARAAVEEAEQLVRDAEQRRTEAQQAVNSAREETENARMIVRETEVRADTVGEQFAETGFDREQLSNELDQDASSEPWAEKLEAIGRKIQRLGAINLAAIDEFEEQSARKEYLDKQHEDLTESLATLEAAIRKIDGETKARFRDTFNRANSGLSEVFPRLFGGGQAYLELDSDDLLSAGVTVMARPPGKRISTIHLMSGGEKALTAVALIFAIFKLNPAPFCMLDEVDAPLDDANVGRFCEIVREMSGQVQFVLITHNKTTMEAMNQLVGVTMHEPGVSRMVAVDIDEAVQLAAM
jgi:chromosome segregation protein